VLFQNTYSLTENAVGGECKLRPSVLARVACKAGTASNLRNSWLLSWREDWLLDEVRSWCGHIRRVSLAYYENMYDDVDHLSLDSGWYLLPSIDDLNSKVVAADELGLDGSKRGVRATNVNKSVCAFSSPTLLVRVAEVYWYRRW
jgi:hypothetical protein